MTPIAQALSAAQTHIGHEVGISNWITVDQPMIDQFAQITQDDQWIHIDPQRAARDTPFGGTIAHGFLTLSLASRFAYDCFDMAPGQSMGINYGFNKLRFLTPVRAGAALRGRFTLLSVSQRSETELLREHQLTVEIKDTSTPALVAQWLGLSVFARQA